MGGALFSKPSHGAGTIQDITPLDLLAFDVIGNDLVAVPDPSSLYCWRACPGNTPRAGQR